MKLSNLVFLFIALGLFLSGPALFAQDLAQELAQEMAQEETGDTSAPAAGAEIPPQENPLIPAEEEVLAYDDYTIKGYTITGFGANFSGAKYLENMDLGPRTILTPGAGDILGYDGEILVESQDPDHFTGAHKEIKSGAAFGVRIGVYISDDFHLDITGTFAKGEAVTTMRFTEDPENNPDKSQRIEVDRDDGFNLIKGGLALMYDATPATFYGIVPRLGFGLGGIINSYTELPDVTGLYLEGNLGLNYELFKNFQIGGQVDLTNFAYDVPELGYSNMVNYITYSVGLTVFLDSIPPEVRASQLAEKND